jgi:hypothetical protein
METNIEARRGEGSGISGLNPEVRAFVLAVAFTL